jgi:preprotein translocase subunit YajC
MQLFLLQAGGGGGDMFSMLVPLLAVGVVFYFMMVRPQQKERKKMDALRNALKKGDKVMTQGGILAKVQQIRGNEIVLDLDGSARLTVIKAAIQTVFAEGATAEGQEVAKT